MIVQIGITGLVAALALGVEHYFPWRLALKRDLPRPAAYILGVLAMMVPLSSLYVVWAFYPPHWAGAHVAALWAVVTSGGIMVLGAYGLDWVLRRVRLADELGELARLGEVKDGEAEE